MVINVADALNAYRTGIKGLEGKDNATPVSGSDSFGSILGNVLGDMTDSLKHADQVGIAAVQGKANINEIVSAMSAAEVSLQTVVSIRDKLVSAYQELMRSGI